MLQIYEGMLINDFMNRVPLFAISNYKIIVFDTHINPSFEI